MHAVTVAGFYFDGFDSHFTQAFVLTQKTEGPAGMDPLVMNYPFSLFSLR